MLCLVRYLFVISTSVIDCLGRFVSKLTYGMSSGTLNLPQLNSTDVHRVPKKTSTFLFFKYLCQKLTDFNDFWCVKSWENLTVIACTFAHLTYIL